MEQSPKRSELNLPRWFFAGFSIITTALVISSIWNISSTTSMGENDFVAYWSSTYLFSKGLNPYDPVLMEEIQSTKLQTGQDVTIMSWNPPTLFVFLLPLAAFSFLHAKFLWLIVNLSIVVSTCLMLARTYDAPSTHRFTLMLLLFALVFPPVVSGLYMGQVTFLVLFGLATAMWLIKRKLWFGAGVALILTSIKPHLVVLPLIYLIAYMGMQRKLNGWIGLITSGLFCILLFFLFRPAWISDLAGLLAIAPVRWATPTLGGLLSSLGITDLGRYLIVLFIPLPLFLALNHSKYSMELSVAVLTLITIPVTFFGWNYDQSMLLIPISLIFVRLAKSRNFLARYFIILAIAAALVVNAYLRLLSSNDLLFVWVPFFWWLIFALTAKLQTYPSEVHG